MKSEIHWEEEDEKQKKRYNARRKALEKIKMGKNIWAAGYVSSGLNVR